MGVRSTVEPLFDRALQSKLTRQLQLNKAVSNQLDHQIALPNAKLPKEHKSASEKWAAELMKQFNDNPTPQVLRSLGLCLRGFDKKRQGVSERLCNERFSANYGVSSITLHALYVDVIESYPEIGVKDFLMGVNELKLYLTEHVQAGHWGLDENTFRRRWKKIVTTIASLKENKIKFDPDDFPNDQIFILSVDGVNFTIWEPRATNPGSHWYDHKSHSAGLSYEVAVDIRISRILWILGPRPGKIACCGIISLVLSYF
jgi:hypothetical protein